MDSSRWVESVRSPAVIPSYEGSGLWQSWRILNYFLSFSSSRILTSPQLLPACYSIFLIHAAFLCFRSLHGVELLHLPLQFGSKQKGVTFHCLCSASQCKTWEHSDYSEELLEEACEAGWHNEGGTWTRTGVACPIYQAIQSVTLISRRSFCTCVNWVLPLPQSWTTFRWVVAKGKWQELLSSMHFSRSSKNDLSCVSESDLRKNVWLRSWMAMYEAKQFIFSVFMLTVFVYWLLHLFSYKYDIY